MNLPKTHWIETDFYGLLGTPLRKSVSPAMHNANFQSLGMNAVYHPYEIDASHLQSVLPALASLRFRGLNVTMPIKQAIIPYLDALDEMGALCRAVNTIRITDGKITGTNTDGTGFVRALKEQGEYEPSGKTCMLLGSGGAARGVSFALAKAGVNRFYILDRPESKEMMASLASDLNAYRSNICTTACNEEMCVKDALANSQLVVNATCSGMAPNIDETPFNTQLLRPDHFVADIVYIPNHTKLLAEAEALGCKTLEGQWMTIWQGAEAFEFWTGEKANTEIMTKIVLESLS